jgi:hypothetical protein
MFVAARQNRPASAPLFAAVALDALLVPAEVVAHEVYAQLSTPLLWRFLREMPQRGDAWAADLVERLSGLCGNRLDSLWKLRLTADEAPAAQRWLASGRARLGDLLHNPENREEPLHAVVLLVARGSETALAPDGDFGLEAGDELLLAGWSAARRALGTTLEVDAVLEYVVTGRRVPSSWIWRTLSRQGELGIEAPIQARPNEVEPAIPFAEDHEHAAYDPHAAQLFWRQLVQADRVLGEFRASFVGKASPVHFFWGAMDLAATRFSGRPAPTHPGGAPNCADWVMEEAYSAELASAGFWPGGGDEGAFYAYAYPEPEGYPDHRIGPSAAYYDRELGEFLLPYEAVAGAADPDGMVAEFLQTTYEAAAVLGGWDRAALEDDPGRLDRQR